jgi:heat shock protein HslJ
MRTAIVLGLLASVLSGGAAFADDSLEGSWRIETIGGAPDFNVSKTQMVMSKDGTMAMSVGCNRMTARPAVEGEDISIGLVAATRMACRPPLGDIELRLREALNATSNFTLENDTLAFRDDSGAPVIVFTRSK